MTEPSLISIITPSLNRADMIATAIESVLAQGYPQFEHLIVDGGSTDGTLDMLKRYPHLRLLSGKDKGVYDALNKGIAAAHGDIIGQLNTDDHYDISAFGRVMEIFDHAPAVDAVVGGARVFEIAADGCERTIATYEPVGPGEIVYRSMVGVPIFNAWFFRKSVFNRVGSYSLNYPIVSDRDFLIRCHLVGLNLATVNSIIYHYCQHPGSLSISGRTDLQLPLALDSIGLAEKYIGLTVSDPIVRDLARDWHLKLALELTAGALYQGNLLSALEFFWRGWRYDPRWIGYFLKHAFLRAVRIIHPIGGKL